MKCTVILVFLCMLVLTASATFGATITVPGDYATIGEAVAAASDGDIINVSPGTYTENIVVDKPVSIRGVKGANVTAVTGAVLSTDPVIQIKSSDVTVSGFTISGGTRRWAAGVWIDGYDYADANGFTAGLSNVTVSHCVLENNTIGIGIALTDGSRIVNNTIRSNLDYASFGACCFTGGIMVCHCRYLSSTLNTQIINNEIHHNDGCGIVFNSFYWTTPWNVSGTKIFGNNFYLNGNSDAGVLEWASDISLCPVVGSITIAGNKILARTAHGYDIDGIWMWSAPDAKVVGNPVRAELGPNLPMPTP
ncbi:MAG: hypothetical protein GTO55_11610 [Armatimonadetes bacterium]|nr:hypothetical protein [Armatimonadota bacterium]NIM24862.1 hypothetical protein [Armatimonadota bacterium]NIM68752.1 hypothetical protein [Armatimonadota bacterium]NIM77013.1 hypothetical protein [Armatimonadota bacterium]NIN06949.1 hypothetical protein [Armatimonadota bacterium]